MPIADAEEFRRLVGQIAPELRAFALRRGASLSGAEDVTQETFVRAAGARETLQNPGSLRSWLMGIADRILKEGAREARRVHVPRGHVSGVSEGDAEVRRAVEGLSEPYRRVVLLRFFAGMTCQQIAEGEGLPIGTVTKHLSRAYALLREAMHAGEGNGTQREVQR